MNKKEEFLNLYEKVKPFETEEQKKSVQAVIDSGALELYGEEGLEEISKQVDELMERFEKKLKKSSAQTEPKEKTPKQEEKKAPKKEEKPKKSEEKKEKKSKYGKTVNYPSEPVRIARALLKLEGKKGIDALPDMVKILKRLQKDIINQVIRADGHGEKSRYNKEMMVVQKALINSIKNIMDGDRAESIVSLKPLLIDIKGIAYAEGASRTSNLIRAYIAIQGKEIGKEKIAALKKRFDACDADDDVIKEMKKNIAAAVNKGSVSLPVFSGVQLSGVDGDLLYENYGALLDGDDEIDSIDDILQGEI